jgi:MFS family permease
VTSEILRDGRRDSPVDGPYAWFRLAVCVLLSTTASIGMWSVVVVLPYIQAEFGVDRASAAVPYTLTMVGFGLGNVIVGRLVDRFGIMWPILAAAGTLGAGFMLASTTTEIWQMAILQGALIGIGTSAGFGPLISNISHWFARRRGIAVAATASGNYIAGALWPTMLQASMAADGWRTTYFGIGILCIVIMVPLALLLRRALPPEEEAAGAAAGSGVRSGSEALALAPQITPRTLQILLMFAGVGCCVAMSMPQVHIVAYCADLGYGVARGAEMLSIMLAGGIVSRLLSGVLADYIGGVRTLLLGAVLQCLALFLFLPFDGLASLYIIAGLFGLSQGGIVPSYAIIVREYLPAREAGQRVGLVIMATLAGMAIGGWMSGWIFDATGSYDMAFVNGIAWNLLTITIMVLLLAQTRRLRTAG